MNNEDREKLEIVKNLKFNPKMTTEKKKGFISLSSLLAVCAVAFVFSSCCCDRDFYCCAPYGCYEIKPRCCPKERWNDPECCDPVNYTPD